MKTIIEIYFNRNRNYKASEIFLNWIITILLLVFVASTVTFSILVTSRFSYWSQTVYKDGTKTTFLKNASFIMASISISCFSFLILSILVLIKLDKRNMRKEVILINELQDKFSIDDLIGITHEKAISIAIEINLQKDLRKNINLESLPLDTLIKRIQRKVYPQYTRTIKEK